MTWPQPLHTVTGPFPEPRLSGASAGMGQHGPATRALIDGGMLSPDLVCGMTLFLLARQPAEPSSTTAEVDSAAARLKAASPIAGGVWVREQFTIHRPLSRADAFTVQGQSTGRFVRRGRRYGITTSRSHDSQGRLVATNLTNGLLSYSADAGDDAIEGLPLDQTASPVIDAAAAVSNPHLDAISSATTGQRFGGAEMVLALAMMAARDTSNPDNPIHSDLEAAKAAGLAKPIAGGSHVLSFALEPLLAAWGPECLLHGTHFDVRWKAPTEADARIVASATVTEATHLYTKVAIEVTLASGPTALVGTLTVPLAS